MKLLIIDTTKQNAYIVLVTDSHTTHHVIDVQSRVSESLLPSIERLLADNDVSLSELDALGVVIGPGGFTGLRVGVATIKAFAQSMGLRTIALNSFDVLSRAVGTGRIYLKCTNSSAYFADINEGVVASYGVENVEDIAINRNIYQLSGEESLNEVETSIIDGYEKILEDAFVSAYNGEQFVKYSEIEPLYVQLSQAEISLAKKDKK